ncbi:MAG: helix-turn-helix domain-containing protein [Rivularia sp. (in: cyanobacteria)]
MLIDSQTGKPAVPRQEVKAVHYHLLLDQQTGLHHASLANLTGYSSVHFTRMFKKATGQTPREYLMHHRINKAKHLLENKELSIIEVAYQSGFSSHAHFSTQFRRLVGTPPQAYRKYNQVSL